MPPSPRSGPKGDPDGCRAEAATADPDRRGLGTSPPGRPRAGSTGPSTTGTFRSMTPRSAVTTRRSPRRRAGRRPGSTGSCSCCGVATTVIGAVLGPLRRFLPSICCVVGLFVLVITLIHGQHRSFWHGLNRSPFSPSLLNRRGVSSSGPAGTATRRPMEDLRSCPRNGEPLGQILQTSPAS